KRTRGVQHACRNAPASASTKLICPTQGQDAVVSLVPTFQAAANIGGRSARFEAKRGVREVVTGAVELWRKIMGLGLTLAAHQGGLGIGLMHMQRDGPLIVEELGIDRPATITLPNARPEQLFAFQLEGLRQRAKSLPLDRD